MPDNSKKLPSILYTKGKRMAHLEGWSLQLSEDGAYLLTSKKQLSKTLDAADLKRFLSGQPLRHGPGATIQLMR